MSQKIFLSIRIVRRHLGIGGKVAKSVFCTSCAILTQTISHSADTTEPMREMLILESTHWKRQNSICGNSAKIPIGMSALLDFSALFRMVQMRKITFSLKVAILQKTNSAPAHIVELSCSYNKSDKVDQSCQNSCCRNLLNFNLFKMLAKIWEFFRFL